MFGTENADARHHRASPYRRNRCSADATVVTRKLPFRVAAQLRLAKACTEFSASVRGAGSTDPTIGNAINAYVQTSIFPDLFTNVSWFGNNLTTYVTAEDATFVGVPVSSRPYACFP